MLKIILLALWALIIANLFVALPAMMVAPLKILGVALIVGHIAEYFIFNKEIKAKGDSLTRSVRMTLVFGIVYVKSL